MAKRKIDNLKPESPASEMEQAIREFTEIQANASEAIVEPTIEKEVVEAPAGEKEEKVEVEKALEAPELKEEFDYKKGYEGLRAWQTKVAQENAETRRVLEELRASRVEKQPEASVTQEQFLEWRERAPLSADSWLAQQTVRQNLGPVEQRVKNVEGVLNSFLAGSVKQNVLSGKKDFSELQGEILKELTEIIPDKGFVPNSIEDALTAIPVPPNQYSYLLENFYWKAKGKKAEQELEKAKETGRQEALAKGKAKAEIHVEGAGSPAAGEALDYDKMSSKDLFELMKSKGLVKES